ncbi:hypothetical protein [Symbiopectobacterium sp. RP]|uniref:hypothetical protein n=1 Tax=Symbiopectobacterium sp. RP TaxID=3248553 RepID=UPI003D2779E2
MITDNAKICGKKIQLIVIKIMSLGYIMNNFHVPAGLLVNFLFWQKTPDWGHFALGSLIIFAAFWVHQRWVVQHPARTADANTRAGGQNE